MLEWLDHRTQNVFECDTQQSLMNTSRAMPRTTYEKKDFMDDFWQ